MQEEVRHFFVNDGSAACRILVAVSGGVDSTALLLVLHEMRFDIVAAHVNHHLRGAESDGDEAFVRDLCARLGVALRVADGRLDPERVRAAGIEGAARETRYAALRRIREEQRADVVATAHQKNDQAETVLMRLLSGSGLGGLRGIHPRRDDGFIRPLLEVSRAQIEAYLAGRGVVPRFDRSNADPRFLRNRVRNFLRDVEAVDSLTRIAEQARTYWPILERAVDEAADAEVRDDATIFRTWPADAWLQAALLRRHIKRLDPHARDFDALRLARNEAKRISATKNVELLRRGEQRILRKRVVPAEAFELAAAANESIYIPQIEKTLHIVPVEGRPLRPSNDERPESSPAAEIGRRSTRPAVIELPPGAAPAFVVRSRRAGDRFQPLGMAQPKKLKDFLIDRRIEADVRDRLPLLTWNDEIVWVAGVEVSERFKVRGAGGMICEVWIDERDTPSGLQR
jgi:tRNA(Ile)-lysidine synthase